jgi:HNH endonuclease
MSARQADLDYETALVTRCREAARDLLEAAAELRWGSGEPLPDSVEWLHKAADQLGILPPQRAPSLPKRRKLPYRAVWDRDDWTCQACSTHRDLTVDHVVAVANGGTDDMDNLQTLCQPCNSSKGARVA